MTIKLYNIRELKEHDTAAVEQAYNRYKDDLGATSISSFERYHAQAQTLFDAEGYEWRKSL